MTKKTTRPKTSERHLLTRTREILISRNATDRFLDQGPRALSDIELLSIFLRTNSRTTPYDESVRLLTEYGSLRELLSSYPRSKSNSQRSQRNYIILQAALELARRHYGQIMASLPALVSSDAVCEFVRAQLRDLNHEVFCCLFLDSQLRAREFKELFRGGLSSAHVYIGEVAKIALARNAAAVIAVHNHPSGSAEPTMEDRTMTLNLKSALKLIDISLLDHLIVADGGVVSFAERGLL